MNTGAQAMVHIWASNTVSMFDPKQSDFADVIKFAPAAAPKPVVNLAGVLGMTSILSQLGPQKTMIFFSAF
ncbi:MAG: hypothetical protein Ct9H300mP28_01100 [Pseudomonadota bacterium]|nr:MAG: hypothetical protein Ct9H300mP28_01100 [Pseudomonadota bacterium]